MNIRTTYLTDSSGDTVIIKTFGLSRRNHKQEVIRAARFSGGGFITRRNRRS